MVGLCLLVVFAVLLSACEGYSVMGSRTSSGQTSSGGYVQEGMNKANGTTTKDIEVDLPMGVVLESTVTLSVGSGSFKIELLDENDGVTATFEAGAGESISGQGWMVPDNFGEASYRLTATEAEDVEYRIDYTFR
jgi:uncharacterized protein YceK